MVGVRAIRSPVTGKRLGVELSGLGVRLIGYRLGIGLLVSALGELMSAGYCAG